MEMVRAEVEVNDGLTIEGVSVTRLLAGSRKVISVSASEPFDSDADRPVSGTEIAYSEFEVDSEDALRRFAEGEAVAVRYVDRVPLSLHLAQAHASAAWLAGASTASRTCSGRPKERASRSWMPASRKAAERGAYGTSGRAQK